MSNGLPTSPPLNAQSTDDPFLWLEEVDGTEALDWVRQRNARTERLLDADTTYAQIRARLLKSYDDPRKIAYPSTHGDHIYNFWQDAEHVRGIIRRTSLEAYIAGEPTWETVLDVDRLAEEEGEGWVYKGSTNLYPDGRLSLVELSRGGGDAVVVREYDRDAKRFIDDGFTLPEAKSSLSWIDENTVYVGTDYGPGSMTNSGYPRIAKKWTRGTPLDEAVTIFEGELTDVRIDAFVLHTPERDYHMVMRSITFYEQIVYDIDDGELRRLEIPLDASYDIFKEQLLVNLRSDWEIGGQLYRTGSLIAIDYDDFMDGDRAFTVIVEQGERMSVEGWSRTKHELLVSTLDNVRGRIFRYRYDDGAWTSSEVPTPGLGSVYVVDANDRTDRFFYSYSDYLTPSTLFLVEEGSTTPREIARQPEHFDASGHIVEQYHAISADGTSIPYFIVRPDDLAFDGEAPTILYGYGGFQVSMQPNYLGSSGIAWVEKGGVYVVANIRGGGEFGPAWHTSALKENRQRAYDDFIAVAEDLIARRVTSPQRLGIHGGSNGGLLVGAVFTQRPHLFNAVVSNVPLLDMKRYHLLLAGASWMAEYGDPDDSTEWSYISRYSPYHSLREDQNYPEVLFVTSTRDDRVHPGHARKMAARMEEMGHPYLYFENIEGGHAGATNHEQTATQQALIYSYFRWKLMEGRRVTAD